MAVHQETNPGYYLRQYHRSRRLSGLTVQPGDLVKLSNFASTLPTWQTLALHFVGSVLFRHSKAGDIDVRLCERDPRVPVDDAAIDDTLTKINVFSVKQKINCDISFIRTLDHRAFGASDIANTIRDIPPRQEVDIIRTNHPLVDFFLHTNRQHIIQASRVGRHSIKYRLRLEHLPCFGKITRMEKHQRKLRLDNGYLSASSLVDHFPRIDQAEPVWSSITPFLVCQR